MPHAELRCFAGCEGAWPLPSPVHRCPRCGGLLDVVHDMGALAALHDGAGWRRLFDERAGARGAWPSGVWALREWVAPGVPDEAIVSLGEGRTPLVRSPTLGRALGVGELWIKQCGQSHTGSFKDLGMTVLVSVVVQAVREGRAVAAVGCASTGDTSAALAAYGAAAGLPVVVLLPRGKVSTAQLVQPIASGARVLALDTDFDGCMAIVERLAREGVLYLANSMNPLRIEGQKSVAVEICQGLDWQPPDWIALPSGNLGNAYALYVGLRTMQALGLVERLPRLLLAQAERANPLYRAHRAGADVVTPVAAEPTLASAIQIGNPVSAPRALRALRETRGVVEQASEQELADAAARADAAGMYVCPHTAVALAAVDKARRAGVIGARERVVVVSTASALKFTDFKVRYHERALEGIVADLANPPLELPADYDRVRSTIASLK